MLHPQLGQVLLLTKRRWCHVGPTWVYAMLHVGQTLSQHVGLTLDRWAESHWANIGKRHWADELSDENPMGQRRFAIWDANFQRFWPMDRGAESLEIRPPTVHSNFTVESKRYKKIWHPRVSVTYLCFLCIFTKMGGSPLYFNAFN